MLGDVDNIVKPIMDGLIRIAYLDDNDVERVTVQKFEPQVEWDFASPGEQLAAALDPFTGADVQDRPRTGGNREEAVFG